MTHPYSSKQYMQALAQGKPLIDLNGQGEFAHLRIIEGTPYTDLIGPYPFGELAFGSAKPRSFADNIQVVSYVTVTDALTDRAPNLDGVFDFVRPYKIHYVYDRKVRQTGFSKHHQYEVNRANKRCSVRIISLKNHLDDWCLLYDNLIQRHKLGKLHRFSREYFEVISGMSSFITLGAFVNERLVAAHIWLRHEDMMYSHLAASNPTGYDCGAAYALYADVIERFENCKIFDLGGVPDGKKLLGLAHFKKGFANDERTNWLCGWIFNQPVYDELCSKNNRHKDDGYFPSYRRGL